MAKAFASQGDLSEKNITFDEIGDGLWAFTAEGDPNSGVIIGDESVMIVEAQATPRLACSRAIASQLARMTTDNGKCSDQTIMHMTPARFPRIMSRSIYAILACPHENLQSTLLRIRGVDHNTRHQTQMMHRLADTL